MSIRAGVKVEESGNNRYMDHTVNIVSSYLTQNKVESCEIVALITEVYNTLLSTGKDLSLKDKLSPAVPVENSIHNDYIVCLEDGKKLKMLKKHLKSAYNMTPEEYKMKWGLPYNYPMVAPEYANRRSDLAKTIGLGKGKFNAS